MLTAAAVADLVASELGNAGIPVPRARAAGAAATGGAGGPARHGSAGECPVLAWAGSGGMWLTGRSGGPPRWPAGDVIGTLEGIAAVLAGAAEALGAELGPLEVGPLLTGRAAAGGGSRRGPSSVGGRSRMLRAADGWIALTLARTADFEVLPALAAGEIVTGGWDVAADDGVTECVWEGLEVFASGRASLEVVSAAQLLGLPAARVSAPGVGSLPWSVERLGETVAPGPRRFRVVDLSAMWAGPLCAHLLGRAGAEVTKVEDAGRPDAARAGDPWLFAQLHRGHEQAVLDFGSATGRRALTELVAGADVVVEASRPRALGHLGFSPEAFVGSRPGRTWVSVTGYGRSGERSNWVAFGDDAAAAGGLVAADRDGPVFCGDAIADPVTGLSAATAALASIARGGGHLVDCSMAAASAFANRFGACGAEHRIEGAGTDWYAWHADEARRVEAPRMPVGPSR